MKCIIIDDEPLAVEVLESYVRKTEHLKLVASFTSALKAASFIQQHHVDLLFVDVQMPKLLGTDLIRSLTLHPQIIITTAYREYALEGFELDILDYLLKPVSFSRFLKAVNKAGRMMAPAVGNGFDENQGAPPRPFIYLKSNRIMVRAYLEDILYAEGLKNYVRVKTVDKDIVTYLSLNALEEKLAGSGFARLHKSYIVNIHRIEKYTAEFVEAGGQFIPIGKHYKAAVLASLNARLLT